MNKLSTSFVLLLALLTVMLLKPEHSVAGPGDTTVVQTFYYDSTMRAGVFMFPSDTTIHYEKIVMLYSMRCKDGLVSTGANTNLGCGEWDYNCYTFVVDSSQTDSLLTVSNSHTISNSSAIAFDYTTLPVYAYTQYDQQQVTYTNTISESTSTVGAGSLLLNNPLSGTFPLSRRQYLFTAAELSAAGFTADSITSIRLDVSQLGSALSNLRINIKSTAQTVLNPDAPETDGFSQAYFLNTSLAGTGVQPFNFHAPFWWNGTSNLIIEFTYTNTAPGSDYVVAGHDAGFNAALASTDADNYLAFNNNTSYVKMNTGLNSSVSNEITLAFWVYGDPARLPYDTYFLEAYDATNKRQVNIHLPWGDSNIYWDCGNDGTSPDRINKVATTSEIEGKWNFWAFTKNAATGTMNIYLNGVLWHSGTGKTKPISIDEFIVGKGMQTTNGYFGLFDELSVWNKALSQTSIQQIMYSNISASHPDYAFLQTYHQFNEASGTIINDASPNNFTAEVINPTRRSHTGSTLFRNFTSSTIRPNTTFVTGTYTQNVITTSVLDSVLLPATSVISYQVDAAGHNLEVIDTTFVWPSGYTYIFNEAGTVIDSVQITAQAAIAVTSLSYYRVRPMYMELINFITPYGINLNMNGLIGKTWEFDVTDFAPILRGARHMEMRDGIYQEDIDIKFVFYEGTPPRDVKSIQQIWPSGSWVSPSYNDILANKYFYPVNLSLNSNASMYKMRSAISGHGQEGEFISRTHTIKLNNAINFARPVWRECATNPIYPQGGTWIYDRAGWCPGMPSDNKEYEITTNVTPGQTINLDYLLPVISNPGSSNYRINNQLVSYDAPNFTMDAAVDYIKSPSLRTEFQRLNPLCNEPVISIKNTGSTQLTSLVITYGRSGGTMSTYNWSGNLSFLQTTEVTLPQPDWTSSGVQEFVVHVSAPNGQADQYSYNDTLRSAFNIPAQLPYALIFEFKTNNYPTQNAYTLKDSQGNIIINQTGQTANTIYRDTVYLADDCYTVSLTDAADDGLSFWANAAQGTGYFRIRNASTNVIVMSFNADFGDNIYQQFTIGYLLPVAEIPGSVKNFNVYPSPASDIITAEFSMELNQEVTLSVVNMLGEVVLSESVRASQQTEKFAMDISKIESGVYYVIAQTKNSRDVRKVVIAR